MSSPPASEPSSDDAAREERERLDLLGHQLAALVGFARTIPIADVELALAHGRRTETILPILDPTRYRQEAPAIATTQRVLAAFLRFRRVLEEAQAKG